MKLDNHDFRERCGLAVGSFLAPFTAAISRAREARMFHPDGVVYRASVEAATSDSNLLTLAQRLTGEALVRFSSALWRDDHEWPDVLGAAIRFSSEQDLLLATIRFPWTMPFAPLATNFRSFLWNHYHAVSPFEVDGVGLVKLRLRSPRVGNGTRLTRAEHLQQATAQGKAVTELQVRRLAVPLKERRWQSVVSVTLQAPLDVDQAALRFSPFEDGAGIRPTGFVHAIRVAAYAASQAARPKLEEKRGCCVAR